MSCDADQQKEHTAEESSEENDLAACQMNMAGKNSIGTKKQKRGNIFAISRCCAAFAADGRSFHTAITAASCLVKGRKTCRMSAVFIFR